MSEDKYIQISSSEILETASKLKEEGYNMLLSVSGVDKAECIEVIYHFANIDKEVIVKTELDRKNPQISSLTSLFSSADWHERETFDLLGVKFLNHPNLTRILLPNDWIGHPLLKDYKMQDERLAWNER